MRISDWSSDVCSSDLFEQGPLPHPGGASYDQHRLIRLPYSDQPGYCAMTVDALKSWRRLWDDLGESHYAEIGSLAPSTQAGDWADRKSVVKGKSVSVRVALGWRRINTKKKTKQ